MVLLYKRSICDLGDEYLREIKKEIRLVNPIVQEFIDFKEIQTLKLVNREIQFKKFLYLVEETKQEAIKESGLSKKEFLKQVLNG